MCRRLQPPPWTSATSGTGSNYPEARVLRGASPATAREAGEGAAAPRPLLFLPGRDVSTDSDYPGAK